MADTKLLEQIRNIVREEIKAETEPIKKQLTTVELNIEILRSENKKAHTEIVENLAASNEINGKQLKDLENRVTQLEADAEFPKSH